MKIQGERMYISKNVLFIFVTIAHKWSSFITPDRLISEISTLSEH